MKSNTKTYVITNDELVAYNAYMLRYYNQLTTNKKDLAKIQFEFNMDLAGQETSNGYKAYKMNVIANMNHGSETETIANLQRLPNQIRIVPGHAFAEFGPQGSKSVLNISDDFMAPSYTGSSRHDKMPRIKKTDLDYEQLGDGNCFAYSLAAANIYNDLKDQAEAFPEMDVDWTFKVIINTTSVADIIALGLIQNIGKKEEEFLVEVKESMDELRARLAKGFKIPK